ARSISRTAPCAAARSCSGSLRMTKETCSNWRHGVKKKTESRDPGETDYRPISCDVYSELEVAILHRTPLRLAWRDGDIDHARVVLPVDLETREHQEFLHGRLESGEPVTLRLDRITHLERV